MDWGDPLLDDDILNGESLDDMIGDGDLADAAALAASATDFYGVPPIDPEQTQRRRTSSGGSNRNNTKRSGGRVPSNRSNNRSTGGSQLKRTNQTNRTTAQRQGIRTPQQSTAQTSRATPPKQGGRRPSSAQARRTSSGSRRRVNAQSTARMKAQQAARPNTQQTVRMNAQQAARINPQQTTLMNAPQNPGMNAQQSPRMNAQQGRLNSQSTARVNTQNQVGRANLQNQQSINAGRAPVNRAGSQLPAHGNSSQSQQLRAVQHRKQRLSASFAGITLFTKILKRTTAPSLHGSIDQAVHNFIVKYQQLSTQSNQNELVRARSEYSRELLTTFQEICGEESIKLAVTEFKAVNEGYAKSKAKATDPRTMAMRGMSRGQNPGNGSVGRHTQTSYMTDIEKQRQIAGQFGRLIKAWNHACICVDKNCPNTICAKIKPSVMHQQQLKSKGLVGKCDPKCHDCSLYRKLCNFSSAQRNLNARAQAQAKAQAKARARASQQRNMMRSHSAGSHIYQLEQAEQQTASYEQPYGTDPAANGPVNQYQKQYKNNSIKSDPYKQDAYTYQKNPNMGFGTVHGLPSVQTDPDPDMVDVANLLGDEPPKPSPQSSQQHRTLQNRAQQSRGQTNRSQSNRSQAISSRALPAQGIKKEKRASAKRKSSSKASGQSSARQQKEKVSKRKTHDSASSRSNQNASIASPEDFAGIFGDELSMKPESKGYMQDMVPLDNSFDVDPAISKLTSKPLSTHSATPDDFASISWS